jgi:hypothetical protein
MKVRHTTRKAKYTLSRILNNDFLRWFDGYLKLSAIKKGERHAQLQTLSFPQARFDALEGQPSQSYCIDHAHLAPRVVRTVAPMHKSNNILITNRADLIGLNNKGGLVR